MDYRDNALTEELREDIFAVLSAHKGKEYNPKCIKGNKVKP
jgi:hypothetical protein